MVNLFDLKWLVQCQKQLKELAGEYEIAIKIVEILDEDPDLRDELSHIYTKAKRTIELSDKN